MSPAEIDAALSTMQDRQSQANAKKAVFDLLDAGDYAAVSSKLEEAKQGQDGAMVTIINESVAQHIREDRVARAPYSAIENAGRLAALILALAGLAAFMFGLINLDSPVFGVWTLGYSFPLMFSGMMLLSYLHRPLAGSKVAARLEDRP